VIYPQYKLIPSCRICRLIQGSRWLDIHQRFDRLQNVTPYPLTTGIASFDCQITETSCLPLGAIPMLLNQQPSGAPYVDLFHKFPLPH
jgi:hypothetical protein